MFSNRFARYAATAVAAATAVGVMTVLSAATASAAASGTITFSPGSGADTSVFNVETSGVCPANDTYIDATISGGGFPANAVAINKEPVSVLTATQTGYEIAISNNLRQLATNYAVTKLDPNASGQTPYTIDVQCIPALGNTVGADFAGQLTFTSETAWSSASSTPTTTTLGLAPTSPVSFGSQVTLTATVNPAAAGSVTFFDGATALNATPVAVANGTASYQTSSLAVGAHTITAAFTSTDANFANSTSAASTYTVGQAGPVATTTSLVSTPGSAQVAGGNVDLTASVQPATAAGSVTFMDGATSLGTVAVSNGSAVFNTTALALGSHSLTASFVPTNTTAYGSSASPAVPFTVTKYVPPTATETITTTVDAGSLNISVPTGQVSLPDPALNSNGTLFTTSGSLETVTVTDNRAGNPGWTASGLATAFAQTGGSVQISAENLGWTPGTPTGSAGQTLTTGPSVAPANGVAASDNGALGLSQSRTLVSAASGAGLGTAKIGATLALNVPTTTTAGTYQSTLTLTVI
ncbi:NHL repeat-containing protein [Catenulispora acidiphila DSM 44928]|uniref:NHL repeat-containing protein n=1 Tax=Catenulispora acidiphila (strain DSM 44928 / JCM 14897 / NBRC 102108 / NRRL B-24433 / ID139908) TaxID=479433 RepID=C7PX53_CATAD|nr:Ig-like domain-containing protein [Catenulispora acidiphila]ACU69404.1 NHL repeat-containing protein [Catenulispora acidiphila DSM 44928]